MDTTNLFTGVRIVPVVVIDDVEIAIPLAESLLDGGLNVIEVTLRTEAGLASIERIASKVPSMIVGAGSIRSLAHLDAVIEAGAKFGVSPGSTDGLLEAASTAGFPFIPGAITPSEMMHLLQQGYRLQKFFPAELAGGCAMLKAVSAPLPEISFMPTGGISATTASDYLALDNVRAIGGSWITPPDLLRAGDFSAISRLAKDAASLGL
ncbi:MAG: keto-deoxy-phosphogluconate aldolase [Acidiferrobacteraceae bacterium]|jgi:2-dehydro-3-deoxyphosphogluconate aldolase/(4S)-4-hydroxy-2-oxoglutarate aldolase|nr:keto-deoxy-phosphogluconate aldolase [Acidiferrobacteraceae bacterium]MAG01006.1 keto-deoxy-phosphogluconate aldolase [Acidiferrobacteraceae bacterium]MDP6411133.1 bifunctional 4-hydroxy-2-oxoglutarate aldolase/2-dehydro-3-deoxy-phosphogluconate aldolase [Arenicellales bacterium]MDP6530691.1 bifunctional 4-hydroxy-2-oxoglutarate aldolase/2-dehydro-3-deoxy-phosphogluconate aldolase [Arenicellales bacterium]MDP6734254.1 bifunctional 4-hydroxy-2-oxoglutarate aldolase/2-dehydro-3-deoxy-phosphogl|tara:strand:- start:1155 stop:1778 length:624 start_codon:yes stop_codon:yes gene_type:complete